MQVSKKLIACAVVALVASISSAANAETLRLLTWGGYAPDELIAKFKAETGIDVEVTASNNEEMISKLRATAGTGFDLAQPSQDRIAGPQAEYAIYKPLDLSKIDTALFVPSMLAATEKNTTVDGKVYAVPHIWGTDGLVVDTTKAGQVRDYQDLCDPALAGKVSYRVRRPALIAFAFSMGLDPFAAYADEAKYKDILAQVEKKLIDCKPNVKTYWTNGDEITTLLSSGEVVAAMAWDFGGWKLNATNPNITFVAPASGALGWIDTFAIPAGGENDEAAYKWINFVMQPENAAIVASTAGNFPASPNLALDPALKARYEASYSQAAIDNIKWYPAVPAGLETIEGEVLDRVNAAQ